MASVSITGTGGVTVSGGNNATYPASGATASGGGVIAVALQPGVTPPELHANQWGLHEFTFKPRAEEDQ